MMSSLYKFKDEENLSMAQTYITIPTYSQVILLRCLTFNSFCCARVEAQIAYELIPKQTKINATGERSII